MERWYIVYPNGRHMPLAACAFLRFLLEEGDDVIEKFLRV
jgi:hypothetical protein